ncbi:TonB-dependent receptor [uncultured Draconibacterium sp.]|uniref:SusC/RagA family TonB-linked outer membrane protein n=1 Tax=uncultured Draconibacterium sp. TaxID=1573823 RepID=UPI0029C8C1AE|nr:TonB-dependent receptor [uncultured Draconibacterium sp.]
MKKSKAKRTLFGLPKVSLTRLFVVGIFLISQLGVFAQQKTLTGTVKDAESAPIIGATVIVKGTTIGTVTNVDGEYTLSEVPDNATLVFSFVGMKTQEIAVGNQTNIDVTMEVDAIGLEEVVAIGYGTQRKKDMTGSIVSVNTEEMEKFQPSNVQELLRGAVPGLQMGYSTSAKDAPEFFIRGDNTIKADNDAEKSANRPLIVLDGVIFNGDIAEINVNDIESVDVLKDASAASIYGSRASNGVIVFTTKKGKLGKATITASAQWGLVTRGKHFESYNAGEVFDWLIDMNESINSLTQDPWSKYENYNDVPSEYQADWLDANGIPGETDPDVITEAWLDQFNFEPNEKENYFLGRGFDWDKLMFHTGQRQDYNLSVSGRNENVSYYWSLGYVDNESVQVGETFKTITSRLNLDVKATNFLNIGINANFAYQDEGQVPIDNGGYYTSSPYDSPWKNIVYNENMPTIGDLPNRYPRQYLKTAGAGSNRGNPFLNPAYTTRDHDRYRIFPTMYAKLTLPAGFTITSRFTTRLDFRKRLYYEDSANPNFSHGGFARREHNQGFEWQMDNILNWSKEIGEHRFEFTGLINAEKNQMWYTRAQAEQFSPTEALGWSALAFGLAPSVASTDEVITRDALMGRLNYAYGNRFNLSASVRQDGYSRFGSETKRAVFPSVSGAWTISNESFMEGAPTWLSFLKLRASWGVNGNSSGLGSYAAYATLNDNKYLNYDGGYFTAPYLYIDRMANPTLAWEKNQSYNYAVDYGFWDGRVRGSVDVYFSETTDLLLDKRLPVLTGFETITTNVGSLKNRGVELAVNTINIENSDFKWTSNFNLSYNNNEIVSLTGEKVEMTDEDGNTYMAEPDDVSNGWFIGENKDVIYDYELDGVYKIGEEAEAAKYGLYPGDFRYVDQNGDEIINSKDRVFQGNSSPPWYGSFINNFTYKDFDLGVMLLAKLGYKGGTQWPFNNQQEYIKNRNWYKIPYWTPNNQIDNGARINSINLAGAQYYQNRSYLRIQNVSLGYNVPSQWLNAINGSSARIAFTIENAAVFTKWNDGDPESTREMPRTYSFSINFKM